MGSPQKEKNHFKINHTETKQYPTKPIVTTCNLLQFYIIQSTD